MCVCVCVVLSVSGSGHAYAHVLLHNHTINAIRKEQSHNVRPTLTLILRAVQIISLAGAVVNLACTTHALVTLS